MATIVSVRLSLALYTVANYREKTKEVDKVQNQHHETAADGLVDISNQLTLVSAYQKNKQNSLKTNKSDSERTKY